MTETDADREAALREYLLGGLATAQREEIQKALDNLVQGRTTIAIAHRLSTLRKADRLVVMDRGRIVEVGPHDALIEPRGAYWRLYEAQARRVAGSDSSEQGVELLIAGQVAAASSAHAAVHTGIEPA